MNPLAKLNAEMVYIQPLIQSHPFEPVRYVLWAAQLVEIRHIVNHVFNNSICGKVYVMSHVQTRHLIPIPLAHNVLLLVQLALHYLSVLGVLLIILFKIQNVFWYVKEEYLMSRFVILVVYIVLYVKILLVPNVHLLTYSPRTLVFKIAHKMLLLLMGKLVSIALLNSQVAQLVTKPIVYLVHKVN